MSTLSTILIALGASLIGSGPGLWIVDEHTAAAVVTSVGFAVLILGTGAFEYLLGVFLRNVVRRLVPTIGIVSDLRWYPDEPPEKPTRAWSWASMSPNEWRRRITEEARRRKIRVNVRLIKVAARGSFLNDMCAVIVNPYGSVYPEVQIRELPVFNSIMRYVLNGGVFVNVADIPFYWAYDPSRDVVYELVPYTYIPDGSGQIRPLGPFQETPFCAEAKVELMGITGGNPVPLVLKPPYSSIHANQQADVVPQRVIFLPEDANKRQRFESVVEEIQCSGRLATPLCFIAFGRGRFLVSLPLLGGQSQSEDTKKNLTDLQIALVLHELSGKRKRQKESEGKMKKASKSGTDTSLKSVLLSNLKYLIMLLIILGVLTGLATRYFGAEEGRYVLTGTTAVIAVSVSVIAVSVAIFQVQVHIRPFVTVAQIREVSSWGPQEQAERAPYTLNACYIKLQNTGTVPAENVRVRATLSEFGSNRRDIKAIEAEFPLLPPGGEELVELPDIPQDVQESINSGATGIDVVINYEWLGIKSKPLEQHYDIRRSEILQVGRARDTFVFKQRNRSAVT